jgi:hypothetical protein
MSVELLSHCVLGPGESPTDDFNGYVTRRGTGRRERWYYGSRIDVGPTSFLAIRASISCKTCNASRGVACRSLVTGNLRIGAVCSGRRADYLELMQTGAVAA